MFQAVIPEFPRYSVTSEGQVFNDHTGRELKRNTNQLGIVSVGMYNENSTNPQRRSVARLVAEAFVQGREDFDPDIVLAPLHINGDRTDCRAENLLWRPRWFVVMFHKEMDQNLFPGWRASIRVAQTGEEFAHPYDAARTYGIRPTDIHRSLVMGTRVRFFGYRFEWVN